MYKPIFHYLISRWFEDPILINCRTVFYRGKSTSEVNNFIYQNKLDSVSALCSKKMALEILRNAFKKGYNN